MIKEKVKALWKLCFEDSEAFIEMYFRLRYNNEVNIAIESGDEVISALQMLPYPMTFCGKQIDQSAILCYSLGLSALCFDCGWYFICHIPF